MSRWQWGWRVTASRTPLTLHLGCLWPLQGWSLASWWHQSGLFHTLGRRLLGYIFPFKKIQLLVPYLVSGYHRPWTSDNHQWECSSISHTTLPWAVSFQLIDIFLAPPWQYHCWAFAMVLLQPHSLAPEKREQLAGLEWHPHVHNFLWINPCPASTLVNPFERYLLDKGTQNVSSSNSFACASRFNVSLWHVSSWHGFGASLKCKRPPF